MRGNIITIGNQKLEFNQFCEKVEKYDLELTRGDVINIIKETKEKNPSIPYPELPVRFSTHLWAVLSE